MKKFKKILAFMLVAAMLGFAMFGLSACGNTASTDTNDDPYVNGEYEANGDEQSNNEIDWSLYPVIVNGNGVAGSSFEMIGEDPIFPTHITLIIVAEALGVSVDWNRETNEVALQGLNGNISFVVGSEEFDVDGETIILRSNESSVVIDGELYVPIMFFRDVFGAGSAYFSGGNVQINTHAAGDMH